MAHFNQFVSIGRFASDPEERTFGQGKRVVSFRFACSRGRKNQQTGQWENDQNPLFIDCEVFASDDRPGPSALIMQYAKKGQEVFIIGELKLDEWDDKQSGQKRSKHKIWVNRVELLGRKEDGGDERHREAPRGNGRAPQRQSYGEPSSSSGEIPF